MGDPSPLLSIVIPTKNRYYYLKILIEALLSENSQEFELIIQDNSDDNSEFLEFAQQYDSDSRFRYQYTSGWLSVIDNCDLGVGAASGDYVCMLGDDDGILLQQSLEVVKFLKKEGIDVANVNKISYGWPDTSHAVWGDAYSGVINHKPFSFKVKRYNTERELGRIVNKGASFGLGNLARLYHGFVSLEKLKDLYSETGSYFPGPSPDMANAIGLTKYIEDFVYIDVPTIISGHCKKSTGGQGGMKQHHGKIENIEHLPKDTAKKWSKDIPYFWSGPTIYSESARRALEATGRIDIKLNYPALYACCLIYERHYSKEVFKIIFSSKPLTKKIAVGIQVGLYVIKIFFRRLYYFLKNLYEHKLQKANQSTKAKDINEVIQFFEKTYPLVEANNIKFK
jgi:glycosyltransferase involved in cell wall biosynthesis